MNISLIGAGYWGKNILRNLKELGVLHSVYEVSKKRVGELREKYPDVNFVTSLEEVLDNPGIKGVCIATPAVTHYEMAKRALLKDKDVFVEKPLSLTIREAEELIKIARERGKILMVGHILQYHPAILKLKELIKNRKLGSIEYIYSNRLNIGKLRVEENILWSFAPHDVSVILMLVGEEPYEVKAFGGAYVTPGIYDVTLTTLSFKQGVKAHIFVSWLHPYKEQKLVVVGDESMAVFDDLTEEKLFVYPHKIKWEGKIPVAEKAERYVVEVEKKEPLKEELRHFIECIETRKTPRTDGEEGLRVLKVLERAEKSLKEGKNE